MKQPKPLTIYDKIGNKERPVLLQEQLIHILQSTPKSHIYTRPAKGGGVWEYVTGVYVKKMLNYIFAWDWDFEVKEKGVEGDLIWVLGRLTVRTANGATIVKEQFGRADLKKKKDGSGYLDYGNDLKSATTDALKKCASELGIASDVYGKNEFREIQYQEITELPTPEKRSTSKEAMQTPVVTQEKTTNLDIAEMRKGLK